MSRSSQMVLGVVLGAFLCSPIWAQATSRASIATNGTQADYGVGEFRPSISADGRFVAFLSRATTLVNGDTNGVYDIFVRDRHEGTTERVSVDSNGQQCNGDCENPSMSADGRYIVFSSTATNLVSGDTNQTADIFLHDRLTGETEAISSNSAGQIGNQSSVYPAISADGRFVVFSSSATNLGVVNNHVGVILRDRRLGTTELMSVSSTGLEGNGFSEYPSISSDGRFATFWSSSTNLVPGDNNGTEDIFLHDRVSGGTERINISSSGNEANSATNIYSAMSADGRYVAFSSAANNLVPGDTNISWDVFVRDRQAGTTERISVDSSGVEGNGSSSYRSGPSVSADGRYVAFESDSYNLVDGDTNQREDVFVRDRQTNITSRVSLDSSFMQGNDNSLGPSLSADGRFISFYSDASNLVPGDSNDRRDVFVRDTEGGSEFTALCDPGVGGVLSCPCSNSPSTANRGCDNSAGTGGAVLSATGGTYLSSDSLVFTTSGEKPTATSVVLQGTSPVSSGAVYGQGVRCLGGVLKRLFTKSASAGSITAPDFTAGDPSVSARALAKGDPISAGQSRWYLVFYRDPVVLGGCPATSTFNCTQTGMVTWSP